MQYIAPIKTNYCHSHPFTLHSCICNIMILKAFHIVELHQTNALALASLSAHFSDLPLADALHPEPEGTLQASAQLEGIAADLDDVVNECTHGRQGEGRGEEHHVAELDEHLLVVLEGVLKARQPERRCLFRYLVGFFLIERKKLLYTFIEHKQTTFVSI